jgi:hypothetical protein
VFSTGLSYTLISLTITLAREAVWVLNQARMQLGSNFSPSLCNNDLYNFEEERSQHVHRRLERCREVGREKLRFTRRFLLANLVAN